MPAVASAGAESALTATRSPSVTIVSSPLRTTTAPAARAASRAEARRWAAISSEGRSSRRPSSPAWGVRTVGASRAAIRSSRPAKALSPSASITSGASIAPAASRASSTEPGSRPKPGPSTPAAARSKAPSTAFSDPGARQPSPPGQPTDITSGWPCSKIASRSAGTATVA